MLQPLPILEYIEKCKTKINYHKNQSIQSNSWNNALSLITVSLAATQALATTIMSVIDSSADEIAIVSGVFSLVIIIASKVRENYQFLSLHYQHDHICKEFIDLHYELLKCLNDYNNDIFDHAVYEKNIIKYSVIINRSHLQHISNCRSVFCCISEPEDELL